MPRPCPIAIDVDGRRCRGEWLLLQGGRLCVRSAWGCEIVELGRARPEALAPKALERIVRGYARRRAKEEAELARRTARLRRRVARPIAPG